MINLSKAQTIEKALIIIKEKYPDISISSSDFEIKVWANKSELLVKFRRLIRFIPWGKETSNLVYDISVDLHTKEIEPLDTWRSDRFYIPDDKETEQIEFIKGVFNLPFKGFETSINEKADRYEIRVDNKTSFGLYFLDKITRNEIMSPLQGSYIVSPNVGLEDIEEDPLVEIT